ncbi:MAG TPA: hypothetical protein VL424_15935 [Pararobbsia sp.]|nr:hypothetical protein [Pararobbsia sp.]
MDKRHLQFACLSLMFGSGTAWCAVQAGDGAVRTQPDLLASLAHDAARVAQLAAASPSEPATAKLATDDTVVDTSAPSADTHRMRNDEIDAAVAATTPSRTPDIETDATPSIRAHAPTHARLSAAPRLAPPPAPDFIASLGTVTVGNTDANDDGAAPATDVRAPQASVLPPHPEQGIAGIAIEPAGAVIAKVTPLAPDPGPDSSLPRTTDPLPLAPAGAAASRAAWTLSTPAPLAHDGKDSKGDDAPRTPNDDRSASDNWTEMKVSDARLDDMRGGFDVPNGLQVAFGIERAVFVNGQLVATTSFNIPNIGQMTIPQAQQLAQALNTTTVVQSGPNNIAPTIIPGATAATIVQNTLNDQSIKALTTINAAVNTLAQFRAMNLQSTINSAVINAVKPR